MLIKRWLVLNGKITKPQSICSIIVQYWLSVIVKKMNNTTESMIVCYRLVAASVRHELDFLANTRLFVYA